MMREAQKPVAHAASSREYSDQSKTASASIVAFYSEVRWRVPQTEATVEWLIKELQRHYDLSDQGQENHCIAVAWALLRVPQPVLWKRFNEILTAASFPDQLREAFKDRLERFSWDWGKGWAAHRRRRRQAPEGPAQLQDHPLTCPPPVLDAASIDVKLRTAAVGRSQGLSEGLGQMPPEATAPYGLSPLPRTALCALVFLADVLVPGRGPLGDRWNVIIEN